MKLGSCPRVTESQRCKRIIVKSQDPQQRSVEEFRNVIQEIIGDIEFDQLLEVREIGDRKFSQLVVAEIETREARWEVRGNGREMAKAAVRHRMQDAAVVRQA